eukprot:Rhum_TRINITY_DN12776_c1_g2::Rhum_TRINITY_DN12776_c1_g2_i1::g.54325::m.54325
MGSSAVTPPPPRAGPAPTPAPVVVGQPAPAAARAPPPAAPRARGAPRLRGAVAAAVAAAAVRAGGRHGRLRGAAGGGVVRDARVRGAGGSRVRRRARVAVGRVGAVGGLEVLLLTPRSDGVADLVLRAPLPLLAPPSVVEAVVVPQGCGVAGAAWGALRHGVAGDLARVHLRMHALVRRHLLQAYHQLVAFQHEVRHVLRRPAATHGAVNVLYALRKSVLLDKDRVVRTRSVVAVGNVRVRGTGRHAARLRLVPGRAHRGPRRPRRTRVRPTRVRRRRRRQRPNTAATRCRHRSGRRGSGSSTKGGGSRRLRRPATTTAHPLLRKRRVSSRTVFRRTRGLPHVRERLGRGGCGGGTAARRRGGGGGSFLAEEPRVELEEACGAVVLVEQHLDHARLCVVLLQVLQPRRRRRRADRRRWRRRQPVLRRLPGRSRGGPLSARRGEGGRGHGRGGGGHSEGREIGGRGLRGLRGRANEGLRDGRRGVALVVAARADGPVALAGGVGRRHLAGAREEGWKRGWGTEGGDEL